MTQVAILEGLYTDGSPDFRTAYPRNMVPVPKENGISKGYLRPGEGILQQGTGPGVDRGAINWNGAHYRVMGPKLVRISSTGVLQVLADIPGDGMVTFDYSFDRLAIAANNSLYYWSGSALTQVTDPDLGVVLDVIWVDGYFMTSDGENIVVTDLNDPTAVNPLKYGSSEADPDAVVGLLKLRNEVYVLNRNTTEVFDNVGGPLFPFERIEGAQMQRGALSATTACVFKQAGQDLIAVLGSGRNESPVVWLGVNGNTSKISTQEIDTILQDYTEPELAGAVLEARLDRSHELLYMHLPDRTLVYDAGATAIAGSPVWFGLDSGIGSLSQYRARSLVWAHDAWHCADPTSAVYGTLTRDISTHYGAKVGWEFNTTILYNESRGAVFHQLELVGLPGRVPLGIDPTIWTSYSLDGELWSQERPCHAGKQGEREKRITWLRQGHMRNYRIQKFRGTSDAHMPIARLEVNLEPLNG